MTAHSSKVEKFYPLIGEQLRKARKEAGLSQKGLADRLGFHASTITHYEYGHGRMRLLEFLQICQELDVVPAELLETAEEKNPKLLIPRQQGSLAGTGARVKKPRRRPRS